MLALQKSPPHRERRARLRGAGRKAGGLWGGLRRGCVAHLGSDSSANLKNIWEYMGGSKNRGSSKWMVYNGKPF